MVGLNSLLQYLSKSWQWNHLDSILDQIIEKDGTSVGLLIEANCTKFCCKCIRSIVFTWNNVNRLQTINIIPSKDNGPYALTTKIGWGIVRLMSVINKGEICCNQIAVKQADAEKGEKHYFQTKTNFEESHVMDILTRMYNQVFTEKNVCKDEIFSMEYIWFMREIISKGHTRTVTVIGNTK